MFSPAKKTKKNTLLILILITGAVDVFVVLSFRPWCTNILNTDAYFGSDGNNKSSTPRQVLRSVSVDYLDCRPGYMKKSELSVYMYGEVELSSSVCPAMTITAVRLFRLRIDAEK